MDEKKRKPRLHELLAVEQERKAQADRARKETQLVFQKQQNQFRGIKRIFRPFSVDESMGMVAMERVEADTRLVQTVPEALEDSLKPLSEALDVAFQIDDANTRARANIEVDGEVLAEQVPATFLLQLEKRVREVRGLLSTSPTFDPVRIWEIDPAADKKHVLRAEPQVTLRKQRTRKYNVMVEATKEHPAQVDIVEVDEPVGEIKVYEWTGMIAPGRKAALIERADTLLAAIKRARARANTEEVEVKRKIGKVLTKFLLDPVG